MYLRLYCGHEEMVFTFELMIIACDVWLFGKSMSARQRAQLLRIYQSCEYTDMFRLRLLTDELCE